MERIKLITSDSTLVGYATIIPFIKVAEGVVWGSRTFFIERGSVDRACMADASADPENMRVYREGIMVTANDFGESPVPDAT